MQRAEEERQDESRSRDTDRRCGQPERRGLTETEDRKTRDTCGDKRLGEDRGSNKGEDRDTGVGRPTGTPRTVSVPL